MGNDCSKFAIFYSYSAASNQLDILQGHCDSSISAWLFTT
jgi:hypothetical protein